MKTILLLGKNGILGQATFDYLSHKYTTIGLSHNNCFPLPKADVLINCAGNVLFGKVAELQNKECRELIDANLTFPWRLSKEFILNNGKHIIHIGSTRSISVAPNKSMYSATKHALLALVRSINIDYGPHVKASVVCPGNFTNGPLQTQDVVDAIEFIIEHPDIQELIIGGQI
jgi:short-subunit dehydrogenase